MKRIILVASALVMTTAHAEKWNKSNNPANFNLISKNKMRFALKQLPTEAKLLDTRLGWSETYWPSNRGGIAFRWNMPGAVPFKDKLLTKEQLKRMSEEEIGQLSPAELYDISQGDYKYSLTKKVLSIYKVNDLWWEGICHGWALAASNYPEPRKTTVTNKDGIRVPFGASDVKGLLSMHDAWNSKGLYVRVGDKCKVNGKVPGEAFPEDGDVPMPDPKLAAKDECQDVNAGAFHVVISNMIGFNSQGFVADVDRFNDVWNQPVKAFESKIHEEVPVTAQDMKDGIFKKVRVTTVMTYGDELEFKTDELVHEGVLGFVSKEPVTNTVAQTDSEKNYEYVLELDAAGNVVGGTWISITRPDMLWMKAKDQKFLNGKFPLAGLNSIYKPL